VYWDLRGTEDLTLTLCIGAGSQGHGGIELLTEDIQGDRVTSVGAHWVPGSTLIVSSVIPCDSE
jgi:hypothetical protein